MPSPFTLLINPNPNPNPSPNPNPNPNPNPSRSPSPSPNPNQERFHLIDAPKSAASAYLPPVGEAGEDGGERVRDIVPRGGTLVLFDSVSLPHEVLATNRLRYGLQGWFHEKLYY